MCRCLKAGHVPSTECARAILQNRAISENSHLMVTFTPQSGNTGRLYADFSEIVALSSIDFFFFLAINLSRSD